MLVDYEIVPRQGIYGCLTPPGLSLHAPLGSFDPGTYTVRWSAGSAPPREAQFVVTAPPAKEAYARIELVAGDRQIIGAGGSLAPLQVRALDEAGRPIVGLQLAMVPALGIGIAPVQVDAFGYTGFNTDRTLHLPGWNIIGGPPFLSRDLATTDANGVATVEPNPSYRYAPCALLFGVYPWPDPGSAKPRFFSFVVTQAKPAGTPRVVVEFVHEPSGNYFITQDDAEIEKLDAGVFSGWKRSIGSFIAHGDGNNDASTVPVCRLFSERFTSHF